MSKYFFCGYDLNDLDINERKLSFGNEKISKFNVIDENDFKFISFSSYLAGDLGIHKFNVKEYIICLKAESHIVKAELNELSLRVVEELTNCQNIDSLVNELSFSLFLVVYNKESKDIVIYNDRFGQFEIYYTVIDGLLYFANDIKPFLTLRKFYLEINPNACKCFIYSGQLIGDISWFKNVKLLNSSSCMTFNYSTKSLYIKRYWSWKMIKKLDLTFDESVHYGIIHLEKAVNSRMNKFRENSLFLSGGRDSAVILLSQKNNSIKSSYFLRSKENWNSSNTVKLITNKFDVKNTNLSNIEGNNQLKTKALWNLSCAVSHLHLHFAPYLDMLPPNFNYFNGIPGDLNLGGTYMLEGSKISKDAASTHPKHRCHYLMEYLDFIDLPFYDLENPDAFYFDTRVRRFTMRGMDSIDLKCQSFPFLDLKLNDFIYGIEKEFRRDRKLYDSILNHYNFKEYSKGTIFNKVKNRLLTKSKSQKKDKEIVALDTILDIIPENQLKFNNSIPNTITNIRIQSVNCWINMVYGFDKKGIL